MRPASIQRRLLHGLAVPVRPSGALEQSQCVLRPSVCGQYRRRIVEQRYGSIFSAAALAASASSSRPCIARALARSTHALGIVRIGPNRALRNLVDLPRESLPIGIRVVDPLHEKRVTQTDYCRCEPRVEP